MRPKRGRPGAWNLGSELAWSGFRAAGGGTAQTAEDVEGPCGQASTAPDSRAEVHSCRVAARDTCDPSGGEPAAPRRRLRRKQKCSVQLPLCESVQTFAMQAQAVVPSAQPNRWRSRDMARKWSTKQSVFMTILRGPPQPDALQRELVTLEALLTGSASPKVKVIREQLQCLSVAARQAYYLRCATAARSAGQKPKLVAMLEELGSGKRADDKGTPLKARVNRLHSILLTYNGDWGLLPAELCFDTGSVSSTQQGVARLRTHTAVSLMFEDFLNHCRAHARLFNVASWSVALEACCGADWSPERCQVSAQPLGTQSAERCTRVHFHMFWAWGAQRCPTGVDFPAYRESRPHLSQPSLKGRAARGRHAAMNEMHGHYYCMAPKTSSVLSATTSALSAQPSGLRSGWIYALYADGKMTADTALAEVVRNRRDVGRVSAQIQEAERAASTLVLQRLMQEVQTRVCASAQPRRFVSLVEETFLSQFERFMDRRRFLVLTGPSGMGKTDYIRGLAADPFIVQGIRGRARGQSAECGAPSTHVPFAAGEALFEVAASGGGSQLPDLKGLNPMVHGWLLVDEGTPEMVLSNKRLFQGKSGFSVVGVSSTNCYALPVASWGVRIVIACNDWRERSAALAEPEREWLTTNSIVVDVLEPLYIFD
jgi:hypothetical protein